MEIEEIKSKDAKLSNAKETLKKEFFGIDSIIDGIIDSMRAWYLFPGTMRKPVVINLWGMTGCGKTSLVKRLCELLEISDEMMYYNLAKLDEDSSEEMEDNISDNVSVNALNPVFVLDEFQYAATIEKDGKENNHQTALKTIWELIDTGKLYSKIQKHMVASVGRIAMCASVLLNCGVSVKHRKLANIKNVLESDTYRGYSYSIRKYFNFEGKDNEMASQSEWSVALEEYVDNDSEDWLSVSTIVALYDIYFRVYSNPINITAFRDKLNSMTVEEFVAFALEVEESSKRGYNKDYSNSLTFVIGNIDEAYNISYDMNPDMDADLFHEMTKKLTMVDIKQALQKRFRNEQIARLGNIIYLYPSFSVSDFKKIIRYYLDCLCDVVKNNYGFTLSYDESIEECIYKESVFPTQGTRPIMSGIYEILETKLPLFVLSEIDKGNGDISHVSLSFSNNIITGKVDLSDGSSDEVTVKHTMKLDDNRKNRHNETQAVTAVHESGHFVMYAKLFGKLPKKLVSNCVSSNVSGFMMPIQDDDEFISKEDSLKKIQVDLDGSAAESVVFGEENITSGASADLESATEIACKMIRRFGMGNGITPCVYTYATDSMGSNGCMEVNDSADNEKLHKYIKSIISNALRDIYRTFEDSDWNGMLMSSAEYLFDNTNMPNYKMRELYDAVPERKRQECVRDENYYRNQLSGAIKHVESNKIVKIS